jgi:hypothetical protein
MGALMVGAALVGSCATALVIERAVLGAVLRVLEMSPQQRSLRVWTSNNSASIDHPHALNRRGAEAKSGHPGTPMALAPLVYTIWNRVPRRQFKALKIWQGREPSSSSTPR